MAVLGFGYDTSFIGTTITQKSFQRDFGLDKLSKHKHDDVTGNITSVYSVGGFFGALFTFFTLEYLGRRWSIIIDNGIFALGGVLTTAANGHLGAMYTGRVLTGFGIGGVVAAAPTYISELSPPAIRGRMTGFFEVFYNFGSIIGFWINYGIKSHIDTNNSIAWRIPMGVQLIPAGIVMLCIPLLRESPTWLLKKGREDDAIKVYSYIRNLPASHPYIHEDVAFVKAQIEVERALVDDGRRASFIAYLRGALEEACAKGIRNRFAMVAMMTLLQPWSGAVAINYYSPTIFTSIGLDNTMLWTGIYGLIKAVASILFFAVFIDTTGRKWPWIVSCIGCAISQYYLAVYIKIAKPAVGKPQSPSEESAGKAATAAIMLYGFWWSFGANGLPLVIASEVFPPSLRGVGGSFASLNVWLWSFVTTKSLPPMFSAMGYAIYIFFGCVLVFSATYAYFFIHETKGLRIDQMDQLFGAVGGQVVDYEKEIHTERIEVVPEAKGIA